MLKLKSLVQKKLNKRYHSQKASDCFDFLQVGLSYEDSKVKLKLKTDTLTDFLELILGSEYTRLSKHLTNVKILNFVLWKDRLRKKLLREYFYEGLYPSILFLSYLALVFTYKFSFSLSIFNLMNDLHSTQHEFSKIKRVADAHVLLIVLIVLVLLGSLYFISKNDLRVLLFIRMHKFPVYASIKMTWTYLFVLYYRLLYTEGLDTQSIFILLSKLKVPLPVSWLAYHLEDSFTKGEHWNVEYLDDVFLIKIQQCVTYEEILDCLQSYINFAEQRINHKFKRSLKFLKGGICLLIISIIKIYYQSLYLPLQIIQDL